MTTLKVVGICLIVLGVVSFVYEGIPYTTEKEVLDIGPIEATREEKKIIPLPPLLGGLALLGGVVLLIASTRR
jgi:hypothetical protein